MVHVGRGPLAFCCEECRLCLIERELQLGVLQLQSLLELAEPLVDLLPDEGGLDVALAVRAAHVSDLTAALCELQLATLLHDLEHGHTLLEAVEFVLELRNCRVALDQALAEGVQLVVLGRRVGQEDVQLLRLKEDVLLEPISVCLQCLDLCAEGLCKST